MYNSYCVNDSLQETVKNNLNGGNQNGKRNQKGRTCLFRRT